MDFEEYKKNFFKYSPNKLTFEESKNHFYTDTKKKSCDLLINNSNKNILLDSLKILSVKFESNEKNIHKLILTYDELIKLIRYTLESQIKLFELVQFNEKINFFPKDFINDIQSYISSYEKVTPILSNDKCEKENNTIKKNNNKFLNIHKSPSNLLTCIKFQKMETSKRTLKEGKINKKNEKCIQTTKSFHKTTNYLISPKNSKNEIIKVNFNKNMKKDKNTNTNLINKSVEKKNNIKYRNYFPSNVNKLAINKSTEKRRTLKVEKIEKVKKQNQNKILSIFTACENLKSSFVFNKKNNQEHENKIKFNCDTNKSINSFKDDNFMIIGSSNINLGIKKQVLCNIPKPSNLANRILEQGRKCINDFNGINKETKKKNK